VRGAASEDEPAQPDGVPFRSEIFALTAMLARLSSKDEATLMTTLYTHEAVPD
jgi:hypothetical protein